jgi:hypothetical protein
VYKGEKSGMNHKMNRNLTTALMPKGILQVQNTGIVEIKKNRAPTRRLYLRKLYLRTSFSERASFFWWTSEVAKKD